MFQRENSFSFGAIQYSSRRCSVRQIASQAITICPCLLYVGHKHYSFNFKISCHCMFYIYWIGGNNIVFPSGYCHEGKSSLSSDLHRFQPIGLGFIFTSNNDGHFIGIEECSSVHKDLDGSYIKRQTAVVAYFNRQKGEDRTA